MNKLLCSLLCLVAATKSFPQASSALPENVRAAYSLDRFGDGILNEMIDGIPLPAPKMVGDTYIDENWKKGAFLLYGRDKSIDGYEVRYDLYKQELEIRTSSGVKVLGGKQVKSFMTLDPEGGDPWIYVNSREFGVGDQSRFTGFLRILHDGHYALVSGVTVKVRRPDYNPAMDVGSRDYRILKKEELFFISQGKLFATPGKRKDFVTIFPEQARDNIDRYIRAQNLDPSQKDDLIKIFAQFNRSFKAEQ